MDKQTYDGIKSGVTVLERALTAAENFPEPDEKKMPKMSRAAMFTKMAAEMDEEERMEVRKAMDEMDKKKKEGMNHDEEEEKSAMNHDEDDEKMAMRKAMDEKDKQIDHLNARINLSETRPIIDEMLVARTRNGMPEAEAMKLENELSGQHPRKIAKRWNEDKWLINKPLLEEAVASVSGDPGRVPENFNNNQTQASASSDDVSLEKLMEEK